MTATVAPIPASYAELIGEAVTLHSAHEKVGFGLKEWEIIAKTSGGTTFPVKAFIELYHAFELVGIELDNADWSKNPLYTATIAWDYKHKRLTFDKVMLPDNSLVTLDAKAWGNRRHNRTAPIIPELRGKKAAPTLADKYVELEKQATSLVTSFPVEGSRNKVFAEMILRSAWAIRGKDTKAPMPVAHGVTVISGKDKAAKIEALAIEIALELDEQGLHGIESSCASLIIMDAMEIQGKKSPEKPTVAPSKKLQNNPHLWNPKSPKRIAREKEEAANSFAYRESDFEERDTF